MTGCGFGVSEEDVENVLRANALKVADSQGKPFDVMAAEILPRLKVASIEKAALYGDDIAQQTRYAYQEIERQLWSEGVLR